MAWLAGYTYRKKKPVNATAAGAQTLYQLKLLVDESSGAGGADIHCVDHCQDFPNDIRFTGDDEQTKHDYWVESLTGTTPNRLATIWIEVATIPASGSVDLYMYYGKTSDSGESLGSNTFPLLFDVFPGSSLDTNKWSEELRGTGASVIIANSECELNVPDDQICSANIHSVNEFTNNIAIRIKRKCPSHNEYIGLSFGGGAIADIEGGTNYWWLTVLKSGYVWYMSPADTDCLIYEMPASGSKIELTTAFILPDVDVNNYRTFEYIYDSSGGLKWYIARAADIRPLGEGFEKYGSNPLNIPDFGMYYGPVHPDMVYFPDGEDGYKYWLFYETVDDGPPVIEHLDLVRSNDGINFVDTGISNHILSPDSSGNWDDRYVADSSIIKVGSTWYMYYCGVNTSNQHRIGLATSADGKIWSRITDGIDGTSMVLKPDILLSGETGDKFVSPTVYYDGTKFWIWYISKKSSGDYCMCLAESTDGKSWAKYGSNPVYEASGETIWHIDVSKYNGAFYCYFCHGSVGNLRLLKSTNKTTWALADNDPVLIASEGWEGTHIYESGPAVDINGDLVLIDDKMWMYYGTRNGSERYYEIGLAKSWEVIDVGIDELLDSATDSTFLNDNKKILITQGAYSAAGRGAPSFLDFALVRKYVSPEPTWGTSGGEVPAPVSLAFVGTNAAAANMLM